MMNISFFRNFLKAYAPSFALRDGLTDMKKRKALWEKFHLLDTDSINNNYLNSLEKMDTGYGRDEEFFHYYDCLLGGWMYCGIKRCL